MEKNGKRKVIERNWANLPMDLLMAVANLLNLIEDFCSFRSVCSSWRSAAGPKENFDCSRQFPLLMLPSQRSHGEISTRLLNLDTNNAYTSTFPSQTYSVGLKGWILNVNLQTGEMCLLHVFSRRQIQLPNRNTLNCSTSTPFDKAALSSSPTTTTDYGLLVIFDRGTRLAFWRSGENESFHFLFTQRWSISFWIDAIFYKGSIYGIGMCYTVVRFDLTEPDPFLGEVVGEIPDMQLGSFRDFESLYFVVCDGMLLLLRLDYDGKFAVFEIMFEPQNVTRIDDIGDRALFVAKGCAPLSLEASKIPGCKANNIYCIRHHSRRLRRRSSRRCINVSSVDIKDSTITRLWNQDLKNCSGNPIWVEPTFI